MTKAAFAHVITKAALSDSYFKTRGVVRPELNSRPPAFRVLALRQSESKRRSDEGLTLETSAFLTFHGGNSNFINSFDKAKH